MCKQIDGHDEKVYEKKVAEEPGIVCCRSERVARGPAARKQL
jgi:hypothetical protein